MGHGNFSDDLKRDPMTQITKRSHPEAEISQRLGMSPRSLYAWKRTFSHTIAGDRSTNTLSSDQTYRLAPAQRFE